MVNILIPMAGRGTRFFDKGYTMPKPLVPVHGKPMIQLVIENLRLRTESRFIFLVLREHLERFELRKKLASWADGSRIVVVERPTEGAACTALLAKDLIDCGEPLLIANSDQWVDASVDKFLSAAEGWDGSVMTMTARTPEWSFVRLGPDGMVVEAAEKKPISSHATVGIYLFKRGSEFVTAAEEMIRANDRVNGEFYTCPVYNYLVKAGKRVGVFDVGAVNAGMYGMGTPEQLESFLKLPISRRAAGAELESRRA